MKVLCYLGGSERSLLKRLDFSWPARAAVSRGANLGRWPVSIAAAATLAGLVVLSFTSTQTIIPARPTFDSFPRKIDSWQAVEAPVDQKSLDVLKSTDNLSLNFFSPAAASMPINVWVAYYGSQEIGEAIHSPQICMPGGGWVITSMRTVPLEGGPGYANRAVIEQNGQKQLVYYWFQGRGRIETSEYTAKLDLMADALLRHRTDGALVRLVVPIDPAGGIAPAEEKLRQFAARMRPLLDPYLPN
jgi:EpsI family protein